MLLGVCLVKTFGSRSRASLFWVTSRDHRFESAKFHLHGRERPRRAAYSGPRYIGPAGRFLLRCSGARTNVPAYLGGGSMPTRPGAAIQVPGTFNQPPDRTTTGGFYRIDFRLPAAWTDQFALLKFGAVRYIADVWLNGHYLGYHEGGDTPFALDATGALLPDAYNNLVVRVDNPEWGTRDDIVPWGLADWWNYGGIVGDVWLEAVPGMSAVRADVSPHLDGADIP